jgi:hypothetical protein
MFDIVWIISGTGYVMCRLFGPDATTAFAADPTISRLHCFDAHFSALATPGPLQTILLVMQDGLHWTGAYGCIRRKKESRLLRLPSIYWRANLALARCQAPMGRLNLKDMKNE